MIQETDAPMHLQTNTEAKPDRGSVYPPLGATNTV